MLHREHLRPTCLKILWVTVDLPIYYVSNPENNSLDGHPVILADFKISHMLNKSRHQHISHFSIHAVSSALCSVYHWHPACGYCFKYSLRWKHNQVTEVWSAKNLGTSCFYELPCQQALIRKRHPTDIYPAPPKCHSGDSIICKPVALFVFYESFKNDKNHCKNSP